MMYRKDNQYNDDKDALMNSKGKEFFEYFVGPFTEHFPNTSKYKLFIP
jgi:hypothetical protein